MENGTSSSRRHSGVKRRRRKRNARSLLRGSLPRKEMPGQLTAPAVVALGTENDQSKVVERGKQNDRTFSLSLRHRRDSQQMDDDECGSSVAVLKVYVLLIPSPNQAKKGAVFITCLAESTWFEKVYQDECTTTTLHRRR